MLRLNKGRQKTMNKKLSISILAIFLTFTVTGSIYNTAFSKTANQQTKTPVKQTKQEAKPQAKQAAPVRAINATSLNIVNNPKKFLNKTVKMQATFDKFSTLGLDYNKALRKSTDYIGILIQRDDVIDHDIPLSEMKLFMKKDMAQKHIDLDTGDKIEIIANVFSDALNDPWLDIESLTIIKKAKKDDEKK